MHLIIDGYNLIHHSPELFWASNWGQGRQALLTALRLYRQKKGHQVTVVFDGGDCLEPWRGSQQGLPLIFSGTRQKADYVIVELAEKLGAGATVITDDRELAGLCSRQGAVVIGARLFAGRLMDTALGYGPGLEEDDESARNGTRKKGPSHREPKAKRRRGIRLKKL